MVEDTFSLDIAHLTYFLYFRCISKNIVLLARAFRSRMVIPEFQLFCEHIDDIYWNCRDIFGGKVSGLFGLLILCRLNRLWPINSL